VDFTALRAAFNLVVFHFKDFTARACHFYRFHTTALSTRTV
jgi:hypothetical protein